MASSIWSSGVVGIGDMAKPGGPLSVRAWASEGVGSTEDGEIDRGRSSWWRRCAGPPPGLGGGLGDEPEARPRR